MSYQLIANSPQQKPHLLLGDSRVRVMPRGDKASLLPLAAVPFMNAKRRRAASSAARVGQQSRPEQCLAVYQRTLIHDEPADLLVDILTELRQYAAVRGWDFAYANRRSVTESKA